MAGDLFLGGGGSAQQSKPLDDELAARFEPGHRPTCLYTPAAMDETKHSAAREWFTSNYQHAYSVIETAGRLSEHDHSKVFDVVYLGGGDTGRLLDHIYSSGFDTYLLAHIDSGRVVYGGSAGAIVLGRTILTAPPDEHSARTNDGLDLLDGRAVVAHYDDTADRDRTARLSAALDCTLLAIPEDAGVVVGSTRTAEAVGGSSVFVFEPHRAPHPL